MIPEITSFKPDNYLNSIIKQYLFVEARNTGEVQFVPARPTAFFMFFITDKPFRITRNGQTKTLDNSVIHGPVTKPYFFSSNAGRLRSLLIEFTETGLYRLFGEKIESFVDEILPLDTILTGKTVEGLRARIHEMSHYAEFFKTIDKLIGNMAKNQIYKVPHFIETIIDMIKTDDNNLSVEGLSEELGYSRQHISRSFKRVVSIKLNNYFRILRFNKLFSRNALSDTNASLYDMNYFDQSHLIKEYRRFAGFTPGSLPDDYFEFIRLFIQSMN